MSGQRYIGRQDNPRTSRVSRITNEDRYRLRHPSQEYEGREAELSELPNAKVVRPANVDMHADSVELPIGVTIDEPARYARPGFKRKRSKRQIVLTGMAFLIFGLAFLINLETLQTNHDSKAQVSALSQNSGSEIPTETKSAANCDNYHVASSLPQCLMIPNYGVRSAIRPIGVTSRNQLEAPTNIYDTGWYSASAVPGDSGVNGALLIDGHVSGPSKPGVFAHLKNLKPGDALQIVRGDKKVFIYKVVKVKNYEAKSINMGTIMASIQPGKPGLNLITCGGPFNHSTREYTQRTVVFAVQQ